MIDVATQHDTIPCALYPGIVATILSASVPCIENNRNIIQVAMDSRTQLGTAIWMIGNARYHAHTADPWCYDTALLNAVHAWLDGRIDVDGLYTSLEILSDTACYTHESEG